MLWVSVLVQLALVPPVSEPFETPARGDDEGAAPIAEPFEGPPPTSAPDRPPSEDTPFEPEPEPLSTRDSTRPPSPKEKPARGPAPLGDRKRAHMVRVSLAFGPVWRIRDLDPVIATGVEYGRMHGFSGALRATFAPPERNRGLDVPGVTEGSLALGAVVRGRVKARPLYASVGLLAGIRIHRAATTIGVVHRVDPDFQLPIQGAWTIRGIGLSVTLVQGYSVRQRTYESRGRSVWHRSAYRVGLLFGLHWDVMVGEGAAARRRDAPRRRPR